jgi:hypothetical protein
MRAMHTDQEIEAFLHWNHILVCDHRLLGDGSKLHYKFATLDNEYHKDDHFEQLKTSYFVAMDTGPDYDTHTESMMLTHTYNLQCYRGSGCFIGDMPIAIYYVTVDGARYRIFGTLGKYATPPDEFLLEILVKQGLSQPNRQLIDVAKQRALNAYQPITSVHPDLLPPSPEEYLRRYRQWVHDISIPKEDTGEWQFKISP